MKSYTINFIRHGMTMANLNGQYAGITDIDVCEQGAKKLLDLKSRHKYPEAELYLTSPLKRCVQTCEILYPNAKVQVAGDLREWNFGDWEGKSPKELMADQKYVDWIQSGRSPNFEVPNGESAAVFGKRICGAFENIVYSMVKDGVSSVNVITHGGVIMSLLATYGLPRAEFMDWVVDNGCGYSVRIMPSLWMRDKVMEVYAKVPEGSNNTVSGKFKDLLENG